MVSEKFLWTCLDSGAQCTVVGQKQAQAYRNLISKDEIRSRRRIYGIFHFGQYDRQFLDTLEVKLPVSNDYITPFEYAIISIDVPLFIGLDMLTRIKVVIYFGEATL